MEKDSKGERNRFRKSLITAETLVLKEKAWALGLSLGLGGYHLCGLGPLA